MYTGNPPGPGTSVDPDRWNAPAGFLTGWGDTLGGDLSPYSRWRKNPSTSLPSDFSGGSYSGGAGPSSLDPFYSLLRGEGGTGGGSKATEGNMGANDLIALSEFLGENVTSFAGGGKMHNPYKYDNGGNWREHVESNPVLRRLLPGKRFLRFEHSNNPNEGAKPRFSDFPRLSMKDLINQFAAANQIKNVSKAKYGMKMKKRYTQGGRF
jgi:hypothetical protein